MPDPPLESFRTGGSISGVGTPDMLDRRQGRFEQSDEQREIAERERQAEVAWLEIDHRAALRAAHAELAHVRDDVTRLRGAHDRAQARLVKLGEAMCDQAEAYDRRLAEAGAAAAGALLDGLDDRSEPPPADPTGADFAAALAMATRNDGRPDAQSSAISDAGSLRLWEMTDARSLRMSAHSLRWTRNHPVAAHGL